FDDTIVYVKRYAGVVIKITVGENNLLTVGPFQINPGLNGIRRGTAWIDVGVITRIAIGCCGEIHSRLQLHLRSTVKECNRVTLYRFTAGIEREIIKRE